jgi:transcriptional regulator with XRE-family HTH domain
MAGRRGPQPIDKQVGERVRMRRITCGVTQVQLADKLGITFQQIQKYEKGFNRIGASRLHQIAQALEVPVAFFFEDLPGSKGRFDKAVGDQFVQLMSTALGQRLIQAISGVTDTNMRNKLLELIESMTGRPSEPKRRKR